MNDQLEQREIDYVRSKVAGNDVRDDEDNVIIAKGETITDDVIDQAKKKGKLHYLMVAAVSSVVQADGEDMRKRLQEFNDVTEDHEADFVRNKQVGRDVKDMDGNILVRQGDIVTDGVIECAKRTGLLQELVLAVGAPGISLESEESEEEENIASKMGYTPF